MITDKLYLGLARLFDRYRLPFLSGLIFGLAAHAFMLTNKIPYGDDLVAMFDKGATTVSGRYGLELMRLFLPDVSMPWIYCLLSILILSIAACIALEVFDIKNTLLRILLPGLFVSFPAEAATMMYMFTVVPYALALTLSVTAVYVFSKEKRGCWIISPLLIAFSCTIYQGYFSIASSFCVVLMIKALVNDKKSVAETLKYGIKLLAMLLLSLAVYGLTIVFFSHVLDMPLLGEVINEKQSLPMRIAVSYSAYLKTIFAGFFGYVHSRFSLAMHLLLILSAGLALLAKLRGRKAIDWLFAGLCLFIFPLSCYCLYMLADNSYIHSLALYSFASLYFLCIVLLDGIFPSFKRLLALALGFILCGNIYYANAWYLRNYLRFEAMTSLYTGIVTQVISTPGFDEETELVIIGTAPELMYNVDQHFDFEKLSTPSNDISSTAYSELIINRYLGFDLPFADEAEKTALASSEQVQNMAVYPYDGAVQKIDNYIVVKFAE